MTAPLTVLIDANVFYGARLRSLVLYLAQTKMFQARWTEQIHDEWMNKVAANLGIDIERLFRTRDFMNAAVLDCLVTGYQQLESSLHLPDINDRHVLAAAVEARANVILTFNLGDFPSSVLSLHGIEAQHPDDFLLRLFTSQPDEFAHGVKRDFSHYRMPPFTFGQYVAALTRAGIPNTALAIENLRTLIEASDEA